MDFFNNLDSKPDHVKAYYSFGFAVVITGVIALVWVSALPARFNDANTELAKNEKADEEKSNEKSFFDVTREQFANVIGATNEIEKQEIESATAHETKENNETSALGSLSTGHGAESVEVVGNEPETDEVKPVEPTVPAVVPAPDPIPPQQGSSTVPVKTILIESKPSTTTPVDTSLAPQVKPRTILIGTSTVQKTE